MFAAHEVAAIGHEALTLTAHTDLIDADNIRCRWSEDAAKGECRFDCFDPVIDIGPVCRYFSHDERILASLRAFMMTRHIC